MIRSTFQSAPVRHTMEHRTIRDKAALVLGNRATSAALSGGSKVPVRQKKQSKRTQHSSDSEEDDRTATTRTEQALVAAVSGTDEQRWDQLQTILWKIDPFALPDLEEWDPTTLPEHFFLVFEGKRRTGKTTFAKWLLQYYQDSFSLVWCMTNTKASGVWGHFVGEEFTFPSWQPDKIEKIIQRNDKLIAEYGEDSEQGKRLGNVLVILDDVVSQKIHDDPMFKKLATEGRHHWISIILMTQDPKAINPAVRDNCDVAVIFAQKTDRNKTSIWEDFLNDTTKPLGIAMLSRFCVNHDCLVSVQTNLDGSIYHTFFKSTIDKTKLKDELYMLGGDTQKDMILKQRKEQKLKEEARRRQSERNIKEDRSDIMHMTVSAMTDNDPTKKAYVAPMMAPNVGYDAMGPMGWMGLPRNSINMRPHRRGGGGGGGGPGGPGGFGGGGAGGGGGGGMVGGYPVSSAPQPPPPKYGWGPGKVDAAAGVPEPMVDESPLPHRPPSRAAAAAPEPYQAPYDGDYPPPPPSPASSYNTRRAALAAQHPDWARSQKEAEQRLLAQYKTKREKH